MEYTQTEANGESSGHSERTESIDAPSGKSTGGRVHNSLHILADC